MQQLLADIKHHFKGFVLQRERLALLVPCSDNDTVVVLKLLRDLEQDDGDDVFLLFADAFEDAESYAEVCIERLRAELCQANDRLAADGEAPLGALPESLLDEARPGAVRLFEAMLFARSLVPSDGRRLVWALVPTRIDDRDAYLDLLRTVLPGRTLQPWMRQGIRLFIRDVQEALVLSPELVTRPRLEVYAVDLGPEAMAAALAREAEDEALPPEQRMQSLLQLAVLDGAYNRTNDALSKYDLLLGYYQGTGNLAMQALVLCSLGDLYRRNADSKTARHYYECAVPPVIQADHPVLFLGVLMNLGEVAYEEQDFVTARGCFEGADTLAGNLGDAEAKVRALERLGLTLEAQKEKTGAADCFRGAATLCQSIGGLDEPLRVNLQHQARVLEALGQWRELAAVRGHLNNLPRMEVAS